MKEFMKTKLTLKDFLVLLYMATLFMPIVEQIVITYLLVAIVGILNILFFIDIANWIKNKNALYIIFICAPIFLALFEGIIDIKISVIFIYQILRSTLLVLIGVYYVFISNKERAKFIFIASLIMLAITSVTSIIVLSVDPMAARIMATVGDASDKYAVEMNMRNLGGFSIVYLLVALIPFLFYLLNRYKKYKGILIGLIILVLIYIFMSSYTIAILIGMLATLFSAFGAKSKNKTRALIFFVVFGLIVFFFRYVIADFFYYLADLTVDIVSNRLTYLADSIYGVKSESDAQIRVDYYEKAWRSFLSSPLIGGKLFGVAKVSGHSMILDTLAKYGLLGGCMIVLEYNAINKLFYYRYKETKGYYYVVLSMLICIILSLLNPGENLVLLLVLLPIGLKSFEDVDNGEKVCNISM